MTKLRNIRSTEKKPFKCYTRYFYIKILLIDTELFSKEEIRTAIKQLKNGKAPGIDNIGAELLKADIETSRNILHRLFTNIWKNEVIPTDWDKGIIVKLQKKGDLKLCTNWRGISLLSIPSKVFLRVIKNRITGSINSKLRQEQAGFRQNRGCMDHLFTLRNIIEQCTKWQNKLILNFIDFQRAFDSITRDYIWDILRAYGVPTKIIKLIKIFYDNYKCSVLHNGQLSDWFTVQTGVRQGCVISPLLFLVVVDWCMRSTLGNGNTGIRWTLNSFLEDLDFADDICLLSSNREHMQQKTTRLNTMSNQLGLIVNTQKTKIMAINDKSNKTPIKISDTNIEEVDNFTYLGSVISNDNGTSKDIKSRLSKARTAFCQLRPIWRSTSLSRNTKLRIYNSNVKSVLLYGSECWRIIQTDFNKLSAFHNTCLRKICKIFWPNKITNKDLYELTAQRDIRDEIKLRRWKWIGHVLRRDKNNISKVSLRWTPTGKRKRGRPKETWRRTVESEIKEMGMSWPEVEKKAQDREIWRELVLALCASRHEED